MAPSPPPAGDPEGDYDEFVIWTADEKNTQESIMRFIGCRPKLKPPVTMKKDGEVDMDEGLTEAESLRKAAARKRVPWLLKDATGSSYEGTYEAGQRPNYAVLMMIGNKMIAIEATDWYNFRYKVRTKLADVDAEDVEALMKEAKKNINTRLSEKYAITDTDEDAGKATGGKGKKEKSEDPMDLEIKKEREQDAQEALLLKFEQAEKAAREGSSRRQVKPGFGKKEKIGDGDDDADEWSDGAKKEKTGNAGDPEDDEGFGAFSDDEGAGGEDLFADDRVSDLSEPESKSADSSGKDANGSLDEDGNPTDKNKRLDKSGMAIKKLLRKREKKERMFEASDDDSSDDADFDPETVVLIPANPNTTGAPADLTAGPSPASPGDDDDDDDDGMDVMVTDEVIDPHGKGKGKGKAPATGASLSRKRPLGSIKSEMSSASNSDIHEAASDPTTLQANLIEAVPADQGTKRKGKLKQEGPPAKKKRTTRKKPAGAGEASDSGATGPATGKITQQEIIDVIRNNQRHTLKSLVSLFKRRLRTAQDKQNWKELLKRLVKVKNGFVVLQQKYA